MAATESPAYSSRSRPRYRRMALEVESRDGSVTFRAQHKFESVTCFELGSDSQPLATPVWDAECKNERGCGPDVPYGSVDLTSEVTPRSLLPTTRYRCSVIGPNGLGEVEFSLPERDAP